MRKALITLLAVCLLLLGATTTAGADQPLRGTMDLYWNGCWNGPQEVIPDWTGTITIGDESYGMAFFNVGTGKPFDHATGMIGFFREIWAIYGTTIPRTDGCAGEVPALEDALMWGYDTGVFNASTFDYHMSGTVEAAAGPFAGSAGAIVHMSGLIVLGSAPDGSGDTAPGVFRISQPHRSTASHQHQGF